MGEILSVQHDRQLQEALNVLREVLHAPFLLLSHMAIAMQTVQWLDERLSSPKRPSGRSPSLPLTASVQRRPPDGHRPAQARKSGALTRSLTYLSPFRVGTRNII